MKQSGLRIGLMVPVNNTTMESELLAWLPESSTCRTLRIARGKATLTPADLPAYVAQAMTMAKAFAGESVDLVVYGCTAAGFMAGPSRDAEIAAELSAVTGKPVVTTASAMIAALRHLGTRNIALISPYLDPSTSGCRPFSNNPASEWKSSRASMRKALMSSPRSRRRRSRPWHARRCAQAATPSLSRARSCRRARSSAISSANSAGPCGPRSGPRLGKPAARPRLSRDERAFSVARFCIFQGDRSFVTLTRRFFIRRGYRFP